MCYHDGSTDAHQQDLLIAGVFVAGAALLRVSYSKLKRMQAARMEKRMLASAEDVDSDASDDLVDPTSEAK